ncbi:MAG: EXPERA domain-containing protein, partial [Vicinamibacteria bacterium]
PERPVDFAFLAFWILNLSVITYMFDLEQVVVRDPGQFEYPVWPPRFMIDLAHWWGRSFDPVLYARPPWFRATIWIDLLAFGPFYACALFAFARGAEWIRVPSLVWSGLMLANVSIILFEEMVGPLATRSPLVVVLANAGWVLMPLALVARMWRDHPFTRPG